MFFIRGGQEEMINVITVSGIRPDFIRFSEIFKKLDVDPEINHILIHTGQHYDNLLSDIFFDELNIREPDYNLRCGAPGKEHFELSGDITNAIIKLLRNLDRTQQVVPDIILFLGDTNSVVCSVGLKKEGYRLGHIEAGMRSYDRRMLEEINRTVCDHCCDLHFVYHSDYGQNLKREGIDGLGVQVVGNTIVEVCKPLADEIFKTEKRNDQILMDIHRPENFKDKKRMLNILEFADLCVRKYHLPVKMLNFKRTMFQINEHGLGLGIIQQVEMMSYKKFLEAQYHSKFLISDSGTAQEEAALLNTPVIVPRDYTERPQSIANNCSRMINMNKKDNRKEFLYITDYLRGLEEGLIEMDISWLGKGDTAAKIAEYLKVHL